MKYSIGDQVELYRPERGYRSVTVVGYDCYMYIVEASSGWQFRVYEDEIKGLW